MTREMERRLYGAAMELREADGALVLRGHAAVFDALSLPLGGFRERIARGAFAKTIREADVRLLAQHDPATVMARTRAGNLALFEDERGLAVEARLNPADPDVQRLAVKVRDGLIDQMSFGFEVIRQEWSTEEVDDDWSEGEVPIRTIQEVRLWDVSPVTFPAYPDTDMELASVRVPLEVRARAEELRAAIPSHSTATVDEPWDGPAAVAAAPNDRRVLRYMHAWVDSEGDPDAKVSYRFPHHGPEAGSPANLRACRNALARLPQANIPDVDRPGVARHVRRHLEDAARAAGIGTDELLARLEARERLALRKRRLELMRLI